MAKSMEVKGFSVDALAKAVRLKITPIQNMMHFCLDNQNRDLLPGWEKGNCFLCNEREAYELGEPFCHQCLGRVEIALNQVLKLIEKSNVGKPTTSSKKNADCVICFPPEETAQDQESSSNAQNRMVCYRCYQSIKNESDYYKRYIPEGIASFEDSSGSYTLRASDRTASQETRTSNPLDSSANQGSPSSNPTKLNKEALNVLRLLNQDDTMITADLADLNDSLDPFPPSPGGEFSVPEQPQRRFEFKSTPE
ncbi:MAG: hypothetical protein K2X01_06430 [Cyanobacteria bacterium]|nr:hypothetical protein [Cyanobacteriota bacterium]